MSNVVQNIPRTTPKNIEDDAKTIIEFKLKKILTYEVFTGTLFVVGGAFASIAPLLLDLDLFGYFSGDIKTTQSAFWVLNFIPIQITKLMFKYPYMAFLLPAYMVLTQIEKYNIGKNVVIFTKTTTNFIQTIFLAVTSAIRDMNKCMMIMALMVVLFVTYKSGVPDFHCMFFYCQSVNPKIPTTFIESFLNNINIGLNNEIWPRMQSILKSKSEGNNVNIFTNETTMFDPLSGPLNDFKPVTAFNAWNNKNSDLNLFSGIYTLATGKTIDKDILSNAAGFVSLGSIGALLNYIPGTKDFLQELTFKHLPHAISAVFGAWALYNFQMKEPIDPLNNNAFFFGQNYKDDPITTGMLSFGETIGYRVKPSGIDPYGRYQDNLLFRNALISGSAAISFFVSFMKLKLYDVYKNNESFQAQLQLKTKEAIEKKKRPPSSSEINTITQATLESMIDEGKAKQNLPEITTLADKMYNVITKNPQLMEGYEIHNLTRISYIKALSVFMKIPGTQSIEKGIGDYIADLKKYKETQITTTVVLCLLQILELYSYYSTTNNNLTDTTIQMLVTISVCSYLAKYTIDGVVNLVAYGLTEPLYQINAGKTPTASKFNSSVTTGSRIIIKQARRFLERTHILSYKPMCSSTKQYTSR